MALTWCRRGADVVLTCVQVGFHDNITSLIGVVSVSSPVMLIIQYCEHGELKGLLEKDARGCLNGEAGRFTLRVSPAPHKYTKGAQVAFARPAPPGPAARSEPRAE